eukprot:7529193-Prorocentrum_lima.AAC.1
MCIRDSDGSQRAAQELGCVSGFRACTPRSQDVSLEADSGSGTGSAPVNQAEQQQDWAAWVSMV